MKLELEDQDIQAIANEVVAMLKPLLNRNGGADEKDVIFDVHGLAEYLKVEETWIYKQVSLRAIPYFKTGKYVKFKKSAIDKWIDSNTVKPIPPLRLIESGRRPLD